MILNRNDYRICQKYQSNLIMFGNVYIKSVFKSHVFLLLELKFNLVVISEDQFPYALPFISKNTPLVSEKVVILGNRYWYRFAGYS